LRAWLQTLCAMFETFDLVPSGKVLHRPLFRPEVKSGKSLDFSRHAGLEPDRLVLRAVTDEIMQALMELSGQE
jgi:1-acyl-sn-glycerol-3-phosphate acyltransferase